MPATSIGHEFEVGNRVFVLDDRHDPVRKDCDACRGQKILRISAAGETKQRRRKCPYCYGKGTVPNGEQRSWYVKGPAKITNLTVRREVEVDHKTGEKRSETTVKYEARDERDNWYSLQPHEVFSTNAAAQAAAKNLNLQREAPPTPEAK